MSVEKIDKEIETLKNKIHELEVQKKNLLDMSSTERLAIELHSMMCNWNHTDGCGWFYEIKNGKHSWHESAHNRYLKKAERLEFRCTELGITPTVAIELVREMK